ncbi:uncharacterized [Tachysurus ichikawai]
MLFVSGCCTRSRQLQPEPHKRPPIREQQQEPQKCPPIREQQRDRKHCTRDRRVSTNQRAAAVIARFTLIRKQYPLQHALYQSWSSSRHNTLSTNQEAVSSTARFPPIREPTQKFPIVSV